MNQAPASDLLTVKQVATELGLAVPSIYTMINANRVKYIVVRRTQRGRDIRIPRSEVEKLKPLYSTEIEELNTTR